MRVIAAAVALCLLAPTVAPAQTKMIMGYSPTTGYVGAFAAKDEGFFAKHGLDVELQFLPINSAQAAGLAGGSIQASALTSSAFVLAVCNGLDLVSAIGGTLSSPDSGLAGVMARQGVDITKPADFVGKKVGVPGIGAVLDIMFRRYLITNGVDPGKVTFVEAGLPAQPDMLKSGALDAVVTVDPMLSRILAAKTGTMAVDLNAVTPNQLMALYAMSGSWAASHPKEVKAFQDGIREGTEFAQRNIEASRTIIGKYSKLPPEVMATVHLPPALDINVTPAQLQWWFDTMKQQHLVEKNVDFNKVILK
jgi:NitT/TauT family transport system substrate-binding protein